MRSRGTSGVEFDDTAVPIDRNRLPIADDVGGVASHQRGGDAVLAGDDNGVLGQRTIVEY